MNYNMRGRTKERIKVKCENPDCDVHIELPPSKTKGRRHCSMKCKSANKRKPDVPRNCKFCGETFYVSRASEKKVYCKAECRKQVIYKAIETKKRTGVPPLRINYINFPGLQAHGNIIQVVSAVCRKYGVELGDLRSSSRKRVFTEPRHVAMYLLKEKKIGPSAAGRYLHRNHATAVVAARGVQQQMGVYPEYRERIYDLMEEVGC